MLFWWKQACGKLRSLPCDSAGFATAHSRSKDIRIKGLPAMALFSHITVNEYPLLSFLFGAGAAFGLMLAWKFGARFLNRD